MPAPRSDTSLLQLLKTGQTPLAAQDLWERYFHRLVGLARKKLRSLSRRAADEEDVALSAFDSFVRGAAAGRFPRQDDRDDLWQVLVLLTERKAINQRRREQANKRSGGKVRGESGCLAPGHSSVLAGLNEVDGGEPSPEMVALFTDECRRLFAALEDPELRVVALLRMEGFTTEEIGRSLERAPRSIERKLHAIRKVWEQADQ
jgi:DNA-directed RNA polymerase specialized sigma24 family protein